MSSRFRLVLIARRSYSNSLLSRCKIGVTPGKLLHPQEFLKSIGVAPQLFKEFVVKRLFANTGKPPERPKAPAKAKQDARPHRKSRMDPKHIANADAMKSVQATTAMLITMSEVDITSLLALEKERGLKPDYLCAFCKAATYALKSHPIINAYIDQKQIVYRNYIDLGVTTPSPKGILTPVIKHIESMNYSAVQKILEKYKADALSDKLDESVLTSGTFTVDDEGAFGSFLGTSILRLSQTATMSVHNIVERPIAVNKKVEVRPMVYIGLTYDHRIIDGKEAVFFLKTVKKAVEEPESILDT